MSTVPYTQPVSSRGFRLFQSGSQYFKAALERFLMVILTSSMLFVFSVKGPGAFCKENKKLQQLLGGMCM